MNKLVRVLAVITLIFAGATGYLANELRIEHRRARAHPSAMDVTLAAPDIPATCARRLPSGACRTEEQSAASHRVLPESVETARSTSASQAGAPAVPTEAERQAQRAARMRARQVELYARVLKAYEDPAARERSLATARAETRETLDRFPQVAGLTDDQANRLVELLAQQQLEDNVTVARCIVDPACATPQRALALLDKNARRRLVADLLGPEKADQYEFFQDSLGERRGVTSLRARLADDQILSDADAERLIEALARERQKYVSEMEQAGGRTGTFAAGGSGSVFYRVDAARSGEARQLSRELDSAVVFSERMKNTASRILTAEQMRVFGEMQEDLLTLLRERNREDQMRPISARDPGSRPLGR